MRKIIFQIFILLGLTFLILLSFTTLMPIVKSLDDNNEKKFSVSRAFEHVEQIAQEPHYTGSKNQSEVRNYIVSQFQGLGLEVHTQNGYVINDYNTMTNPENIIAVLEGTDPKPKSDLLVMAHYDSEPHSSFGAADDAAGVATILESLRVFLKKEELPKNNIIFLISDAEEIGLLGAQLFVEEHDLVENIGLVLNFEARGTSGPSNAILETNGGNNKLVKALVEAGVQYPVTSSLMYDIYKTMPNDTDATVFREEKNIPGFFFAFIDGHYNYHAATDTAENLSLNSLAHQGSYLTGLLPYFGNKDLNSLEDQSNRIFFDFPFFNIVNYDYGWIFPLLILAWLGFFLLLGIGFRRQSFNSHDVFQGFKALIISLIVGGILGFYGWKLLLQFYPQYTEIQQGFPYNGHLYVAAFIALSGGLLFITYHAFSKRSGNKGLLVAPLTLWLIICTVLSFTFQGATYFIITVLFFEIILALLIWKNNLNPLIILALSIPTIFIFSPLVLFISVALGLNMVFVSVLLFLLQFWMLLPIFENFKRKNWMGIMALGLGVFFLVKAHMKSEFSEDRPKPNSLVYVLDKETNKAQWKTYDHIFDEWSQPYFTDRKKAKSEQKDGWSKYGAGFTYTETAPIKDIPGVNFKIEKDSNQVDKTEFLIKISPERDLSRINLFSDQIEEFSDVEINNLAVESLVPEATKMAKSSATKPTRILTYYNTGQDTLRLKFSLPKKLDGKIEVYGVSNDLLDNPYLKIPAREKYMIPRPFVLNDAIITKQTICL